MVIDFHLFLCRTSGVSRGSFRGGRSVESRDWLGSQAITDLRLDL